MAKQLSLRDFDPSGKIEITVEEVHMIHSSEDDLTFGQVRPNSLFETACYKYTVLMMNTQAVMMIIVILANLLLLLTGLKRYRHYQLMKMQKKQLAKEQQQQQTKVDLPPAYEKVVIEPETSA